VLSETGTLLIVPPSGLFLDIKYGNLLKLDAFANILACVHGHKKLNMAETLQYYPSNFITVDQIGSNKRFLGLNTLYARVHGSCRE
jgi:hypothetical protein